MMAVDCLGPLLKIGTYGMRGRYGTVPYGMVMLSMLVSILKIGLPYQDVIKKM